MWCCEYRATPMPVAPAHSAAAPGSSEEEEEEDEAREEMHRRVARQLSMSTNRTRAVTPDGSSFLPQVFMSVVSLLAVVLLPPGDGRFRFLLLRLRSAAAVAGAVVVAMEAAVEDGTSSKRTASTRPPPNAEKRVRRLASVASTGTFAANSVRASSGVGMRGWWRRR